MTDDKGVQHASSYRDPSGYIFTYKQELYRQVNLSFQNDFEVFINSGLYHDLVKAGLLVPHQLIQQNFTGDSSWFTTIKPEPVPFISYPYEWSFSMLKDAALLTIELVLKALEYGMILKDASPYNVQLYKGQMAFIDTLSFETYTAGEPWIAYRQFCENFIAPLSLMHYTGLPMQQLLLAHPDGIPLQYVKKLLPFKSRFNIHLYLHIHLHGSVTSKASDKPQKSFLSKQKLVNLLKGLQDLVTSFSFKRNENVWGNYYEEAATRPNYLSEKKEIVAGWIQSLQDIKTVIDIGGNTGEFAALAAGNDRKIICADGEHHAIESLYNKVKSKQSPEMVPLVIDFTSPSPAIGVNNSERASFLQRASSDLAMMLALVHHLAIAKNIPFYKIAEMCAGLGRYLIIEFVPKEDEKVQVLLQHKKDIYDGYTKEAFANAFAVHYRVIEKRTLSSSPRIIYLMERL
ncbi:MAG: SAM-dependent methyltransferase [Flavisolibacter sp.]|nr:SAM-dependent methyltransferase [Flavisolibacter sp.]